MISTSTNELTKNTEYEDKSQRRIRGTSITFLVGPTETVQLKGKEKYRIQTFLLIIDTLNAHLKQLFELYKEGNKSSSFLSQLN